MSFLDGGKDPMKPDELRNLFIFFVVATVLYFSYDAFILKPQKEALQQATEAARQAQIDPALGGPNVAAGLQEKPELRPREDVISETARLEIDNGEIFGSLSLKGAQLDDIAFHEYYKTVEKKEAAVLLSPSGSKRARSIRFGWLSSDKSLKLPTKDSIWRIQGNDKLTTDTPVKISWDNGAGLVFQRTLSIDEHYLISVEQNVINNSGQKVTLFPYGVIGQNGLPIDFTGVYLMHEGPIGYLDDELHEIKYKTMGKGPVDSIEASEGWFGVTDKYWLTAFIPEQGKNLKYNFGYSGGKKDWKKDARYQVDYVGEPVTLSPGQSASNKTDLFAGAKRVLLLKDYGEKLNIPNFDLAVDFGIFWFMTKPFFYALHFLGLWIGNMGFAIIALTVIIRMLTFPLTNTSYTSFAKMKKVSPQVAALREQHEDKQELQKHLMELYKKEGVNPMAGCLPILLQIPIFFALYKTFYVTIEIRHAPFVGWIHDLSAADPTSVFNLFGLIPWEPWSMLMIGAWPCFMLVAQLIQKKLNPPPQDPLQRDMMNYFPFIITFIIAKFPSGLVVYWACSAWIGLVQQMYIMRKLDVPIHLFGETEADKKIEEDIEEGGPAVHPLVDMAEEEVEDALFGDHDDEPKKEIKKPKPKKSKKKKK